MRFSFLLSSTARPARVLAARWLVPAALAGAALVLGCSKSDAPLDAGEGPESPELAHAPGCETAPDPIQPLIDAQFRGDKRATVRQRCDNIVRKAPNALGIAIRLADYIKRNSRGTDEDQIELINALLCVSQGQSPGGGCALDQLPPDAEYNFVGPGGGKFLVDDGKIGYLLRPGWSTEPRIVFTVAGDCALNESPFASFPECALHGTIPAGPFAAPHKGILAHCAIVPDEVDTANLRLARNLDDFDHPPSDAPNFGGIEVFPDFAAPFALPGCTLPEPSRKPLPSGWGAAPAGGKRGGPGGVSLAAKSKKVGGQISAFSEWGIVDIGSESATIEGIVRETASKGPARPFRAPPSTSFVRMTRRRDSPRPPIRTASTRSTAAPRSAASPWGTPAK
jgi:hypothetical protein